MLTGVTSCYLLLDPIAHLGFNPSGGETSRAEFDRARKLVLFDQAVDRRAGHSRSFTYLRESEKICHPASLPRLDVDGDDYLGTSRSARRNKYRESLDLLRRIFSRPRVEKNPRQAKFRWEAA